MRVVYGYRAQSEDDKFLAMADELSRVVSEAIRPGAWLVDIFPLRTFQIAKFADFLLGSYSAAHPSLVPGCLL